MIPQGTFSRWRDFINLGLHDSKVAAHCSPYAVEFLKKKVKILSFALWALFSFTTSLLSVLFIDLFDSKDIDKCPSTPFYFVDCAEFSLL